MCDNKPGCGLFDHMTLQTLEEYGGYYPWLWTQDGQLPIYGSFHEIINITTKSNKSFREQWHSFSHEHSKPSFCGFQWWKVISKQFWLFENEYFHYIMRNRNTSAKPTNVVTFLGCIFFIMQKLWLLSKYCFSLNYTVYIKIRSTRYNLYYCYFLITYSEYPYPVTISAEGGIKTSGSCCCFHNLKKFEKLQHCFFVLFCFAREALEILSVLICDTSNYAHLLSPPLPH